MSTKKINNIFSSFFDSYNNKLIYTPGPTMVPSEVLQEMSKQIINPDLDPDFPDWLLETCKKVGQIINTENEVLILPGEGMLALDAAINSIVKPKEKVIVLASGIFGHGFANMVKDCKAEPILIATDRYDEIVTADMVEKALDENPDVSAITVVHCETPSGTLNPLEEIGKICQKKSNAILIADTVSSVAGAELKVDEWGVDIALGASQKCFSAPPGIAFLSLSEKARKKIENRKSIPSFYSDLSIWTNSWLKNRTLPYTHSISSLVAFRKSIDLYLQEGHTAVLKRHKVISDALINAIESLGLELFPKKKEYCSPTVTALKTPQNISDEKLRLLLWKKYGVLIAGAWGPVLGGKVLRLGNMGYGANPHFTLIALNALEKALNDLGYPIKTQEASQIFLESLEER
ncbi:MAG: alanine--glyoxylate aminotransferase family protein [Asgard group archaeon]|nr:alanine--glyoxylate aminotransferase family protein [Asgard group archaeon]